MGKAVDPSTEKRLAREEKLAAALRANLRRRKAKAGQRPDSGGKAKTPAGS